MDSTVVTLPSTLREFLYAIALVQDLQVQMVCGAQKDPPIREIDFSIAFRLQEEFRYFQPCLQVISSLPPAYDYSGWNEYSRGEYKNFIEFDFETAKSIAKANKLHISEALGAMFGTTLNALFFSMYPAKQPVLLPLMLPKGNANEIRVAIVEWDTDTKQGFAFKGFLENNYPDLIVKFFEQPITYSDVETACRFANDYDIWIAGHSELTLIAASLDKQVFEIFDTVEEQYLYHNANLRYYFSDVGKPTAEYMWFTWEQIWEDLRESIHITKSQDPTIQTAPLVSTVKDVDVKSSASLDLQLEQ